MKDILSKLSTLREYSGNAQIDMLRSLQSDLLKQVLTYCLDTHKKYKINELKYDKINISINPEKELTLDLWNEYTEMLDYLSEIKSAKDTDIIKVKYFIESFKEVEERDFLKMVLYKDLRLNMGAKKIQKVWNDFCVTYPYMGCSPYNQKNLQAVEYPAFAQTKMDGSFCNIIVDLDNNKVEYISRQSKPQPIQGSMDNILLSICPKNDPQFTNKFVLTGEVLVWDEKLNKPLPRKLSNGILRRKNKTQRELDSIHFVCWDFLPFDKFLEKRWDEVYSNRYDWLSTRLGNQNRIHIVNTWIVNNIDEAMAKFEEQYELGEEGIVVKSFNQIWQDGKPSGQVKVKAEKTCELRMIGFKEGKGNYSGMCGNIRCISEDSKLEVYVKPRTPKDAQELWDNQNLYMDKILEVKFNEVIDSDNKDLYSLYLPVFVEIRDDKNKADTFDYIKSL